MDLSRGDFNCCSRVEIQFYYEGFLWWIFPDLLLSIARSLLHQSQRMFDVQKCTNMY